MGRVVDGTAADRLAEESGLRARPIAEAGWRQAEKVPARGEAAAAGKKRTARGPANKVDWR